MSDQQIQKVKVKRLAHVGLWTTDILSQAKFYHHILGLDVRKPSQDLNQQDQDEEETMLFLGQGEELYNLGLYTDTRPTSSNGRKPVQRTILHHLTFEVDTAAELAALAARLKISGVDLTLGTAEGHPDMTDSLWFSDPDGNRVEIAVTPEDLLLTPSKASPRRSAPTSSGLQHVALYTTHLEAMVEFYTEALGFDISDWLLRERAWLRCNSDHHTLLFILGKPAIDHIGYTITNEADLLHWADYLSSHQIPIVWGPGRHGAGNDLFLRFVDPEGIHIELSTGMQQYYDRDVSAPPRLWHTRTTALNLWGTLPSWIREEAQV